MVKVNISIGQTRDKFGRFSEKLALGKKEHLQRLADKAVLESPVDTGTYITEHEINSTGVPSGFATSAGKPRRQPYEPFAQEGLGNLYTDIDALPEGFTTASMTNKAGHADIVEDNYGVYAIVKREADRIAQEVFNGIR